MMPHSRRVIATGRRPFSRTLEQAEWVDGRVTTGAQGAQVKNNQQVDTRSALYAALQNEVLNAVNQHALFFAAALRVPFPRRCLIAIRTMKPMVFMWMAQYATIHKTAVCALTFLPRCFKRSRSYDGGELVVNDTFGQHRVKLPAGDLVLYPSSSLHCVTPVTRGVRVASFMWIQSMIRDDKSAPCCLNWTTIFSR